MAASTGSPSTKAASKRGAVVASIAIWSKPSWVIAGPQEVGKLGLLARRDLEGEHFADDFGGQWIGEIDGQPVEAGEPASDCRTPSAHRVP